MAATDGSLVKAANVTRVYQTSEWCDFTVACDASQTENVV